MKVRNYMAILRNLRNIIEAGVDEKHMDKVLRAIADPIAVRKSKQLPFRFLSAYKSVDGHGSKVLDVLETAVDASIDNLPKLPGTTVIAVDVSGSMGSKISAKSDVTCSEIALLLGFIANRICDNAIALAFDTSVYNITAPTRGGVLYNATHTHAHGGGTNMSLPFETMLQKHINCDRVIILSDNEVNSGYTWYRNKTVQALADEYRRKSGNDIWVHAIDLQGYGTQQFHGTKTNIIAGWSEKVFDFIRLAEQGEGTIEKTVAAYRW